MMLRLLASVSSLALAVSPAFADLLIAIAPVEAGTVEQAGAIAYVTDASSPTYNAALTGGAAVKTLAMCNGSACVAH